MNITDEDNDTPIYTVETIESAKWLVEHGAVLDRRNNEGLSVCSSSPSPLTFLPLNPSQPSDHLAEEYPEISAYLISLGSTTSLPPNVSLPPNTQLPSEHAANTASETLAEQLMASVRELASASGGDGDAEPSEEEIRRAVERVVLHGMDVGREMGQSAAGNAGAEGRVPDREGADGEEAKRQRREE